MGFTLANCERIFDAAEVLIDRLAVRGTHFWSPADVAEETAAKE